MWQWEFFKIFILITIIALTYVFIAFHIKEENENINFEEMWLATITLFITHATLWSQGYTDTVLITLPTIAVIVIITTIQISEESFKKFMPEVWRIQWIIFLIGSVFVMTHIITYITLLTGIGTKNTMFWINPLISTLIFTARK